MKRRIFIICIGLLVSLLGTNNVNAQCSIPIDTANITQVTCPGGNDGFASLTPTYYINYSWDNITNGQNYGSGPMISSVNTLAAGLYIVTGTNPFGGCPPSMTSDTFEILEPILTNDLDPPLNCFSNCDVTSTINISQTFPGYTYQVSINGGSSQPLPAVDSNLCAGNIPYVVSYDSSGTTISCPADTFSINADSIEAIAKITDTIKCFGDLAEIQIYVDCFCPNPDSGWYYYEVEYLIFSTWYTLTSQYSYDTATIINLPANTYRITVTDSAGNFTGCQTQVLIIIPQPPEINATFTETNSSLCFGDSIASLNLSVFGGIPPYNVTLNGGPSLPIFNNSIDFLNLTAGAYQVIVTDSNGCTKTRNRTITSPPELLPNSIISSNYNGMDISCFGGSDGAILAQVLSGGTPGFQFAINQVNNPLGTYTGNPYFQNLSSGTYAINYIDTNGCTASDTLTLQDPPDLSGTISVSSAISCNSVCDGQLTFNVDAILIGTPIYQYSLDGGAYQTSATFGGLCGDSTYIITVRDINGCTYTDSLYLTQPDSLDVYVSVISNYNGWGVSCFGATDGIISVDSINGGTPNYTASIDGGAFLPATPPTPYIVFTSLAGGPHQIIVQDASGCSQPVNITISEPNPYSIALTTNVNYNGFDVACNGDCNGSIHVTSTGGVPSYLYSLNGGASQASSNFNGQCAGLPWLRIDAIDANNCPASDSLLLIEPPVLTLQMDSVMENCGAGDGQAIALVGGGVIPYFYLWTDGQTTSTADSLSTGTYTVIVTDTNGCSIVDSIFVPGTDMILSTSSTDVSCNTGNDGTATVTVIGSYAPPLVYQWDDFPNFQTTATATGLVAGWYYVTVTDSNLCSTQDSIFVFQPNAVFLELDSANSLFMVPCFGDSLGVVSVSATGGTGPGTYWFYIDALNPQNDSTFYGLPAGNYLIFVTDANSCIDSVAVQITEPTTITFTLSSTDVLCNGGASGTAEVASISGGTPPYSYVWSTGATTDSIDGLIAGTYWLTVTDSSGCTTYPPDTVTIDEPTLLTTSVSSTSSMCGGTIANGTAGVVASGGTTNYTYLWNTGATTANINLLVAGTYTVTVTDANGCEVNDSAIVQAGPNPILGTNLVTNVSCFGAGDGYLVPFATGGTPPLTFSINGSLFNYSIGDTIGPSGPASYWLTVRDSNGCVTSDSVFVLEPALLVIDSFSINEVSCYGDSDGEITVNHSGGTPGFTYVWSDGQTTQTATGLDTGIYSVIVTDINLCADTSFLVVMTQPDSLYIDTITSTDVLCNGGNDGTATVNAMGGVTPYSYLWSNGAMTQTANMSAGNNSVDVIDLNGCIVSDSIMVNEPAALLVDSFVMDSVFCFGFSDGSATAYVSGGIPAYTYLWDNGDTTAFADTLDAGYHVVTITDFNNCVHTDSVEVLEPAASVSIDSLIVNHITCKNASNGSIVVLATGGIPSYTYSKDGGSTYQTAIGFIGLSPATYNIVVKDNRGCTASKDTTITEPDSLLIDSVVFSHVSCFGYNNGHISNIYAVGGTSPYMYSVNGSTPQQYPVFNSAINPGLIGGPGTYTVEVFDANNCVVADIIIIEEPQPLNTNITTSDYFGNGYEIKCNGDSTGWITVTVTGGVVPYLKTWINAQGDTVQSAPDILVDSLNAGLYTLVVMDGNACTTSQFITMTEPDPIQHNFAVTHVTCNGWNNGSITDSIYGGVPGYSYLWNTGAITHTINSLDTGWYTMTVTDENNCISIDSVEINADDSLTANVTAVSNYNGNNVRCYGYCDAWIEVTISGGMPFFDSNGDPIYTNIWDDPLSQITPTAIGLCGGEDQISYDTTYTITITDAIGCQVIVSETITQPSEIVVTASVLDGVSCYSDNDGKLKAVATGGTPAGSSYTYDWNTGFSQTGLFSTLSSLGIGSYVVIATDANGCMDTTEIYLGEPTDLSVNVTPTDVNCYGIYDGTITAEANGGTPSSPSPPGNYTYVWSDGQSGVAPIDSATGLAPGLYYVTVTDNNGCTITSSNVLITQPASPLIVTADSINETICVGPNDGEAIANVFGGTPPYNYIWNNGNSTTSIANLSPNTYTVYVTDDNGCTLSASTYVHAVNAIFLPSYDSNWDTTICLGDNATISVVNNPAYTYSWAGPDGFSAFTPNIMVTPGDPVNHYILTVTDPSCNKSFSITAIVFAPQLPINLVATPNPIKVGDVVEIIATVNGYSRYDWYDENGEHMVNSQSTYVYPEVSTTYYIEVEDAGCKGYDSIRVVVGPIVYNGISPNGDGYNDFWEIEDIARYPDADIEVYNRWGSLLFSAKGDTYNDNKWDGTHNGEPLPIGTYYYIINLNNNSDLLSGAITIIR